MLKKDFNHDYWQAFCSDKLMPDVRDIAFEGLREYWKWLRTKEQAELFCKYVQEDIHNKGGPVEGICLKP